MDYVHENFEVLQECLQENFPQITITQPEATYFVWLDLRRFGLTPERLKEIVENEAHITVTFGEPMGAGGEGHIRINLATARATLDEGLKRLVCALQKHT